ncbi:MAG: response regulator, partial [Nitrospinae bacterium]|nr:response regulator [Nitrospinota bacterium]
LEEDGHTVAEAANGAEGEACFDEQGADLVVTDLNMPKEDGLTLIASLKKKKPTMPIIAISGVGGGSAEVNYLEKARKMGADSILKKPFDAADIRVLIAALL